MNENLEKAKKMFLDYCCSSYFMAHDGADYEYKSYGPTKELEAEWRAEYIAEWTSKLSLDDFYAVRQLIHAWAVEALPDLIEMCDQAEGYAKLEYADAIWDLLKAHKENDDLRRTAVETVTGAWRKLSLGGFSVPERFHKEIALRMIFKDATTPENYVISQARIHLAEAEKTSS